MVNWAMGLLSQVSLMTITGEGFTDLCLWAASVLRAVGT